MDTPEPNYEAALQPSDSHHQEPFKYLTLGVFRAVEVGFRAGAIWQGEIKEKKASFAVQMGLMGL